MQGVQDPGRCFSTQGSRGARPAPGQKQLSQCALGDTQLLTPRATGLAWWQLEALHWPRTHPELSDLCEGPEFRLAWPHGPWRRWRWHCQCSRLPSLL